MRSRLSRYQAGYKGYLGATDWGSILDTVNQVADTASNVVDAAGGIIKIVTTPKLPSPTNPYSYLQYPQQVQETIAPPPPVEKKEDNTTMYLIGGAAVLGLGALLIMGGNKRK